MDDLSAFRAGAVLVMEDEPIIALDIEETLSLAGIKTICIVSSCAEAESWLKSGSPSFAIVDPRLRDGTCGHVAQILVERDIPFVVYSGDGKALIDQEPAFAAGMWLSKPSHPQDFIEAVKTALGVDWKVVSNNQPLHPETGPHY